MFFAFSLTAGELGSILNRKFRLDPLTLHIYGGTVRHRFSCSDLFIGRRFSCAYVSLPRLGSYLFASFPFTVLIFLLRS